MTERYAEHDEHQVLMEGAESSSGAPLSEVDLAPLIARIEALERGLDELTGEAETVVADEFDSGEA